MSATRMLGLTLLLSGVTGCGTLHAPRGSVPKPAAAGHEAYGGWAIVTCTAEAAPGTSQSEGELLAVSRDSLWLLRAGRPLAIATATIQRAEVTGFDSGPGMVQVAATLGFLSTISNGAFLLLTAPAWLITGAAASQVQAGYSRRTASGPDLAPLALYARFPHGLPPGLDLATLRPRPVSQRR